MSENSWSKICPICGKEFPPSAQHSLTDGRGNFVCSPKCSTAAYNEQKRKKEEARERARQRRQEYEKFKRERAKMESNGEKVERSFNYNKKSVGLYTKDGDLVKEYPTVTEASKDTGYSPTYVSNICRGVRETNGEFTFRFMNHADDEQNEARKSNGSKPVLQYTIDGKFVARHASVLNTAKAVGCCAKEISLCCNGIRRTAKGFIFEFEKTEERK